jgi:hypothetical protein
LFLVFLQPAFGRAMVMFRNGCVVSVALLSSYSLLLFYVTGGAAYDTYEPPQQGSYYQSPPYGYYPPPSYGAAKPYYPSESHYNGQYPSESHYYGQYPPSDPYYPSKPAPYGDYAAEYPKAAAAEESKNKTTTTTTTTPTACASDAKCAYGEYCAAGTCRAHGSCGTDEDCYNLANYLGKPGIRGLAYRRCVTGSVCGVSECEPVSNCPASPCEMLYKACDEEFVQCVDDFCDGCGAKFFNAKGERVCTDVTVADATLIDEYHQLYPEGYSAKQEYYYPYPPPSSYDKPYDDYSSNGKPADYSSYGKPVEYSSYDKPVEYQSGSHYGSDPYPAPSTGGGYPYGGGGGSPYHGRRTSFYYGGAPSTQEDYPASYAGGYPKDSSAQPYYPSAPYGYDNNNNNKGAYPTYPNYPEYYPSHPSSSYNDKEPYYPEKATSSAPANKNVTTVCQSDYTCAYGEYCAAGICRAHGTCSTDDDCYNLANYLGKGGVRGLAYRRCVTGQVCGVSECEPVSNCPASPCEMLYQVCSEEFASCVDDFCDGCGAKFFNKKGERVCEDVTVDDALMDHYYQLYPDKKPYYPTAPEHYEPYYPYPPSDPYYEPGYGQKQYDSSYGGKPSSYGEPVEYKSGSYGSDYKAPSAGGYPYGSPYHGRRASAYDARPVYSTTESTPKEYYGGTAPYYPSESYYPKYSDKPMYDGYSSYPSQPSGYNGKPVEYYNNPGYGGGKPVEYYNNPGYGGGKPVEYYNNPGYNGQPVEYYPGYGSSKPAYGSDPTYGAPHYAYDPNGTPSYGYNKPPPTTTTYGNDAPTSNSGYTPPPKQSDDDKMTTTTTPMTMKPCATKDDCDSHDEYCAVGVCRAHGTCQVDADCYNKFNLYGGSGGSAAAALRGKTAQSCQSGHCQSGPCTVVAQCSTLPCDYASCDGDYDYCVDDYCGACGAKFYNAKGLQICDYEHRV